MPRKNTLSSLPDFPNLALACGTAFAASLSAASCKKVVVVAPALATTGRAQGFFDLENTGDQSTPAGYRDFEL
jgi:hypothetical protein